MPLFDLPIDRLHQYAADVAEPTDFDAFWSRTLAEASLAAPDGRGVLDVRPGPDDLALMRCWDVTFAGFAGDPVRAWFTLPVGAREALPVVVEFVGYGRGRGLPHERLTWPAAGYAHLLMDSRGQGCQYGNGGDTPDLHDRTIGGPGPIVRGVLDPQTYYYRRLVTDAVRAVAAVRELDGVDPTRVVVSGNSQGGGLALAVAGLAPQLAAVLVTAPLMCDLQRAIELTDQAPYGEVVTFLSVHREAEQAVRLTLSYLDGVSFARRATAPAHFGVGLRDTVCPPRTAFAARNAYGELVAGGRPPTVLHAYPFNHHEGGEALHVRRQLRWLREVLAGAGQKATGPV
jgi:cephalosporin-C deacetylase